MVNSISCSCFAYTMLRQPFVSLMVQVITLALAIVIKDIKVEEIRIAPPNGDPMAMLEDSA